MNRYLSILISDTISPVNDSNKIVAVVIHTVIKQYYSIQWIVPWVLRLGYLAS